MGFPGFGLFRSERECERSVGETRERRVTEISIMWIWDPKTLLGLVGVVTSTTMNCCMSGLQITPLLFLHILLSNDNHDMSFSVKTLQITLAVEW